MDLLKPFRRKTVGEIIIHTSMSIIFGIVALSYVYILFWSLMSACKTHTAIIMEPFALPEKWLWEHFLEVPEALIVGKNTFWHMLFNSCYFSILGAFISQFVTLTFSYCCTKYKFFGSELPYTIILIMITLPIYGAGGAQYRLYRNLGLVDTYLHILSAFGGMQVNFLYFRAYFKNLSWTYAEAAQIDGAGHFQIYFKIMFPQARPIFGALFVTSWLGAWADYTSPLLYLPNLPTLPVGIYQFNTEMIYRARLDILFAGCLIVTLPALILFVGFNKIITTNVSLGGIKG